MKTIAQFKRAQLSYGELVVNALALGRAIVTDPEAWTKGCEARNDKGQEVATYDNGACKFCMVGALNFAAGNASDFGSTYQLYEGIKFLNRAIMVLDSRTHPNVTVFNDSGRTTHRQMLAVYDKAVELAEKEFAL